MDITALVGLQNVRQGAKPLPSLGAPYGEALVSQVHGKYYHLVREGLVYAAMTAVAGVDHGSALGTTGPFTLHNPRGNDKDLVLLWVGMAYVSGTLGAGMIVHAVNGDTAQAAPTGTEIKPINCKTLRQAGSSMQAFTTSTIVAPTQLRPFCSVAPILATSVVPPWLAQEDVEGSIILPPGAAYTLQGVCGAAGTTPRVVFAAMWAEIPHID